MEFVSGELNFEEDLNDLPENIVKSVSIHSLYKGLKEVDLMYSCSDCTFNFNNRFPSTIESNHNK